MLGSSNRQKSSWTDLLALRDGVIGPLQVGGRLASAAPQRLLHEKHLAPLEETPAPMRILNFCDYAEKTRCSSPQPEPMCQVPKALQPQRSIAKWQLTMRGLRRQTIKRGSEMS